MVIRKKIREVRDRVRGPSPNPPGRPATERLPVHGAESQQVQPQPTQEPNDSPESGNNKPTGAPAVPSQRLELKGLWREAYQQLQQEKGSLIDDYENFILQASHGEEKKPAEAGSGPDPRLETLVKNRLKDIEESRFKITIAGKEFVARDCTRRAIQVIRSVKDLVTAVVTFEPHAAVAWAGVMLLLDPVAKSITQDEEAMSGYEQISVILVRYRLIEHTHIEIYAQKHGDPRTPPEQVASWIRTQTVKLYAEIFKFQIRLAQHFIKSGFYRFMNNFSDSTDWRGSLNGISVIDKGLSDSLDNLNRQTLKEIKLQMDKYLEDIVNVASEARDEARAAKQAQLLSGLPVASGAVYPSSEDEDKPRCMEDSQVSTLSQIEKWKVHHF
ncbi:hypothetical protein BDV59DRAFT_197632 [Aspergillus ambiguus]|uniref:uncharacterized protein n=1 Tax=Aspergillus ambiguus TaxID=176160 RepID=UPI003CCDA4E6